MCFLGDLETDVERRIKDKINFCSPSNSKKATVLNMEGLPDAQSRLLAVESVTREGNFTSCSS